jgi:hypothetical protein
MDGMKSISKKVVYGKDGDVTIYDQEQMKDVLRQFDEVDRKLSTYTLRAKIDKAKENARRPSVKMIERYSSMDSGPSEEKVIYTVDINKQLKELR